MGGAISQAVSRRPAAAKARVQTKGCEICGGQSGPVGGFPPSVTIAPYSSSATCCSYQ